MKDFIVPNNQQAEMSVIGAMLNSQNLLSEVLAAAEEVWFYFDETRTVFRKIAELSESASVNAKVVSKHIKDAKLKTLIERSDTLFLGEEDFDLNFTQLKNTYVKRQLYYTAIKALNLMQHDTSPDTIVEVLDNGISSTYFEDLSENIIDPKTAADAEMMRFIEGLDNPESNYGIRFSIERNGQVFGFPSLDQTLFGAKGGDLILFGAKTGDGKTALALNIARIFSVFQPYKGYYQNTEMTISELVTRIVSPIADVTAREIMTSQVAGSSSERDFKIKKVNAAYDIFAKSNLYLSRIPSLSMQKSKSLAKLFRNRYKSLDYLIIDYIGRMDLENSNGLSEWQTLYQIAKKSKEMAVEMNIPVIILSQLNEDGFIEGAKKIKNECDGVFFFSPINDKDREKMEFDIKNPEKQKRITHKITKEKVRRDDNPLPIYCEFKKKLQQINEVMLF